jgi:hypothetical protein
MVTATVHEALLEAVTYTRSILIGQYALTSILEASYK